MDSCPSRWYVLNIYLIAWAHSDAVVPRTHTITSSGHAAWMYQCEAGWYFGT